MAAQATSRLVEDTLKAVKGGTIISGEVVKALRDMAGNADKVLDAVMLIFQATDEQPDSVAQVSKGIDQAANALLLL